jgi:hypothetical protein
MPVLDSTNSQVPSANARAADVAEKAINEIMPEMQQRSMSAFRPKVFSAFITIDLMLGVSATASPLRSRLMDFWGKMERQISGQLTPL